MEYFRDSVGLRSWGVTNGAITQLKQMAIGVANQMHMLALNADQGDAKAEAQAALAYNRAIGFQPKVHDTFQCPRCWVANETRSPPLEGARPATRFSSAIPVNLKYL